MSKNTQSKELSDLAKQVKRSITMNKRKKLIQELPECPTLLSLNELTEKTGLPYQFLRKMIVEEKQVPYLKVGNKFCVNYELFVETLKTMGVWIVKDNKETVSDKVAYYSLVSDAYKIKHKIRYKMFSWLLKHIELCLGEESAIWLLMQEIKSNRK